MSRPVIGVTGLPCSGKSLAARCLADGSVTGVAGDLLQADDIGHEILLRPAVVEQLQERFGAAIVASEDPIQRRREIAARVFADAGALAWLEALIHPLVLAEMDKALAEGPESRPLVAEAALLFGSGMERRCGRILLIEADFSVRLTRAATRGWDRAELERRERRQLPLFAEAKKGPLKGIIRQVSNNSDPSALREQLRLALLD